MGTRLALRIQERFDALTASERKLADLLLDRPDEILTFSASELSRLAGVSKATAARFFRNLGYADFNDVRLQAREERNRTGPIHQAALPFERASAATTVSTHLQVEIANLTRTFEELRSDLVQQIAEKLAGAPRLWVVGLGAEATLARHAQFVLGASGLPSIWSLKTPACGPRNSPPPAQATGSSPSPSAPGRAISRPSSTSPAPRRIERVVVTDPTSAARAARYGATALPCHVSAPSGATSYTAALSMLALLSDAVAAKLGPIALRRSGAHRRFARGTGRHRLRPDRF